MRAAVAIIVISLLAFCLQLGTPALAQDQPPSKKAFKFTDTQVQDALNQMAKEFSVQIIRGKAVSGSVTATLQAADAESALTAICATTGLLWRKITFWGDTPNLEPDSLSRLVDGAEKIRYNAFLLEGGSDQKAIAFYNMAVPGLPKPAEPGTQQVVYFVFTKSQNSGPKEPEQRTQRQAPTSQQSGSATPATMFRDFERQFGRLSVDDKIKLYNMLAQMVERDPELMQALRGGPPNIEFPEPPPPPDDTGG
jgi:hypothetical protein